MESPIDQLELSQAKSELELLNRHSKIEVLKQYFGPDASISPDWESDTFQIENILQDGFTPGGQKGSFFVERKSIMPGYAEVFVLSSISINGTLLSKPDDPITYIRYSEPSDIDPKSSLYDQFDSQLRSKFGLSRQGYFEFENQEFIFLLGIGISSSDQLIGWLHERNHSIEKSTITPQEAKDINDAMEYFSISRECLGNDLESTGLSPAEKQEMEIKLQEIRNSKYLQECARKRVQQEIDVNEATISEIIQIEQQSKVPIFANHPQLYRAKKYLSVMTTTYVKGVNQTFDAQIINPKLAEIGHKE